MDKYCQIFEIPKETLIYNDFLDVTFDLLKWSLILMFYY